MANVIILYLVRKKHYDENQEKIKSCYSENRDRMRD